MMFNATDEIARYLGLTIEENGSTGSCICKTFKEENTMSATFMNGMSLSNCILMDKNTNKPVIPAKPRLPEGVRKVETYNNRVVKVIFTDDSFTTAVCSKEDTFNIDVGITICILKRLLVSNVKEENATKAYNDLIRAIHVMMDKQEKAKIEERAEKVVARAKREKALAKKERKHQAWVEEQINIQKEAYIRAMKEIGMEDSDYGKDITSEV